MRRMSFSDNVKKNKSKEKKRGGGIDHVRARSTITHSAVGDKDLHHQKSHVCKGRSTRLPSCSLNSDFLAAETLSYEINGCLSCSNANMLLRYY